MLAALVTLNFIHPGRILQGPDSGFKEARRAKKEAKKEKKQQKKMAKEEKKSQKKMSKEGKKGHKKEGSSDDEHHGQQWPRFYQRVEGGEDTRYLGYQV
jgi:hypothetical protein